MKKNKDYLKTGWKNVPTVAQLKKDLDMATPLNNSNTSKINEWRDYLNATGSARFEGKEGFSKIVPKTIRKQAEWRYPALSEPFLSTNDLFSAAPRTHEDRDSSIYNPLILNYQFNNELDRVNLVDQAVRVFDNEGTLVFKLGWVHREKQVIEEQEVPVQVPITDPIQLVEAQSQGLPLYTEQMELQEVTTTKILESRPDVVVVTNSELYVDPHAKGSAERANFIIHKYDTSISHLKRTGKYHGLDKLDVDSLDTSEDTLTNEEYSSVDNFDDKARKEFQIVEYWGNWDINGDGTTESIVAVWVDDVFIRLEENPYPDKKFPFVLVPYLPKVREVFGESDAELLIDNQRIIGAVTRGMIDSMARSANGQVGMSKNALDPLNKRRFHRGLNYEFNPIDSPGNMFHMNVYPEIPQSALTMLQLQNSEAESLTGVKSFSSGISGDALGSTATGVRGAMDSAGKRELAIIRRLADGFVKVGKKIISMNEVFLPEEISVRITEDKFEKIHRDNLSGQFDLKITINTTEDKNTKAQELAFMLQTDSSSDPAEIRMIRSQIATLRDMPDLAKEIKEYQPQPDPVAEKLKELEVAKLEMEIAKIQAMTQDYSTKSQLNIAKAEEAQAKADAIDLEFVETETGTRHERDLDKISQTGRSQEALARIRNERLKGK